MSAYTDTIRDFAQQLFFLREVDDRAEYLPDADGVLNLASIPVNGYWIVASTELDTDDTEHLTYTVYAGRPECGDEVTTHGCPIAEAYQTLVAEARHLRNLATPGPEMCQAADLSSGDTFDAEPIFDWYDATGIEYEYSDRLSAESSYWVVDRVDTETHRETGQPIAVIYSTDGTHAVPASLVLPVLSADNLAHN